MVDDDDRNTTGAQWHLTDYLQPIISCLRGKGLSKLCRTLNKFSKLHFVDDFVGFGHDSCVLFLTDKILAVLRYMHRQC